MVRVPFCSVPFPLVLEIAVPGRVSQREKSEIETEGRTLHGPAARLGSFPGEVAAPGLGGRRRPGCWRAAGRCPRGALSSCPDPGSSCLQDSFTLSDTAPTLGATSLPPLHSFPRRLPRTQFLFPRGRRSPQPLSCVPASGSCGCSPERHRRGRPWGSPRCVCQPPFSCQQVLLPSPDVLISGPCGRAVVLLEHF